jgi:hypothetical protein
MSQWLRDERGLYYSIEPDGSRYYNPPSLAEKKARGNNDSFFRDEVWDTKTGTYKKKTNWNNLLALGAGGAVGAGALNAALAGGGAAAGGAATAVPSMPWTIPAGFEASMAGLPAGAALGGIGAAGASGAAGAAGRAAAGAGSGFVGGLKDIFTDPKTYAGLAGLLTTLATRPNGGSGSGGDLLAQNPQLQRLLDMSAQRAERTDPLHQAVTQLAMGRLPVNVQR